MYSKCVLEEKEIRVMVSRSVYKNNKTLYEQCFKNMNLCSSRTNK